ncbi:hypothetical protein LPTSP2_39560, partial [Leptospira ellinghausenii]
MITKIHEYYQSLLIDLPNKIQMELGLRE